ncbi:MAG: 2-hydroxychromene-2-carboxylate isomerase [Pseudomonadota bacterium]
MATIDYFVSLNSPWTYLGGQRFLDMCGDAGLAIRTKPTKFADVFAVSGGLPLGKRSAQRQAYRMMELRRWRDRLDIPICTEPQFFPSDETAGARLVIRAEQLGQDGARLTLEIGRELWERDTNIAEEAVLATACKRAGLDYDQLSQKDGEHQSLDDVWNENTEEAIARGVFGAPSYVFEDAEIFWGQDRLSFVEDKIKGRASQTS